MAGSNTYLKGSSNCDSIKRKSGKSIEKIFNEMEYGFKEEKPLLALKWIERNTEWIDNTVKYSGKIAEFRSTSKIQFIDSEDSRLSYNTARNEEWFSADKFHRLEVLKRLASLLEQNKILFGHLDAMGRNIPLHNILENDVQYFIQYFNLCAFMPLQLSKFFKNENWNPDHIECIKISNLIPLYEICWNICPLLICGQTVKLAVDYKSVLVTLLFIKLCNEAGVPEDVLRLESIAAISGSSSYFGQSAAVIFGSVDINSVVDSVIEGAWSHHGLIPWSMKRVLVQETVYSDFIKKFVVKMKKLRSGCIFNRLTNIGKIYNPEDMLQLQAIVSEADSEGFEVYQVEGIELFIKPTMIVGRPQCLFENCSLLPVITVEAFRTIEECIKLVKNSNFFTSASLWTNSYSVLQKATLLLMRETGIQTVWMNSHGMLDPSVPFVLQDVSHGVREDLLSFLFKKSFPDVTVLFNPKTPDISSRVDPNILSLHEIEEILLASSKAQITWQKFEPLKKLSILSEIAVKLLDKNTQVQSQIFSESSGSNEAVESFVEFIINVSSFSQNSKNSYGDTVNGDSVIISYKQQGVIVIKTSTIKDLIIFLELVLSFIAFGNSLIVITEESEKFNHFCDFVKDFLPLNLITVVKHKFVNAETIVSEVAPDLEVLAAKAFISKSTWSAK